MPLKFLVLRGGGGGGYLGFSVVSPSLSLGLGGANSIFIWGQKRYHKETV